MNQKIIKFKQTELGEIPEDWNILTVGELPIKIGDGNYSSKYPKSSELSNHGIPFISGKDIKNGRIQNDSLRYIDEDLHARLKKGHIKTGDVLIVTRADIGVVGFVDSKFDDANINAQLVYLRADEEVVNGHYLYFLLTSKLYYQLLRGFSSGSAQSQLPIKNVLELPIILPSIQEQQKIVEVLGALDEKIELNRKMNKTLESLAQAIFKKWFSNAESDSIVELGKKITIRKGKNITKDTVRLGSVPVVAGGLNPSCYHDTANTVSPVVTVSASGANAGFIRLYHDDVWASDCSYIDKSVTPNVYFYYLYLLNNSESVTGLQRGSAQPHVYPKDLMELMIPDYDENLISEFEKIVEPIFRLISINSKQIESLSQIRDSLLPRLMSGKLRAI